MVGIKDFLSSHLVLGLTITTSLGEENMVYVLQIQVFSILRVPLLAFSIPIYVYLES